MKVVSGFKLSKTKTRCVFYSMKQQNNKITQDTAAKKGEVVKHINKPTSDGQGYKMIKHG